MQTASSQVDFDPYKMVSMNVLEELMRTIFDVSVSGVFIVDENYSVVVWNQWMEEHSSIERSRAIGRSVTAIFPQLSGSRIERSIQDAIERGNSSLLSHALMRTSFPLYSSRSTTKPISQVVCIKPLDICVSRKYSIIQINDVTAAVLREEQLRKATTEALGARDAAEQLSQLKSSFVSTVSHELRTPLTSISGALTLLESGVVGEMSEKASSMVEMALRNTNRLMMLINDILDMEKIERGRMEFSLRSIDLHDVLKSAVADTQAYAERFNVHYRLSCDEGCWVNGDAGRLGQVMNNFLSNGAKFEPAGGEVKVLLRKIGGAVRVSVVDHGSGVPEEFKNRIFQKFSQAEHMDDRTKGGTGLGLAISKSIIEHHGGNIGYTSEPNVKTVFYFELPLLNGCS